MAMKRAVRNIFCTNSPANILNPRVNFPLTISRIFKRAFSEEKGFWSSIVTGSGDARSGAHSKILSDDTLYELQCKCRLCRLLGQRNEARAYALVCCIVALLC